MNEDGGEAPPRDVPEHADYAVIRSVGALRVWRGHLWRWDGEQWQRGRWDGVLWRYVPTDDQSPA